jgi:hypothetical protein
MPLPAKPTRTPGTEAAYRRRALELARRCRKNLGLHNHERLDYRRFTGWLITQKGEWTRETWRQYKAATAFFLEELVRQHQDATAEEALETLLKTGTDGCMTKSTRTSGSKLKRFPVNDYRRIEQHLQGHPAPWNQDLRRWLTAGILTGLRPREWGQTLWTDRNGEPALEITNAKATNGRAHGVTRTLLLGNLTEAERVVIREHVERAQVWANADQFAHFQRGVAATLGRAVRSLWPRRAQRVTLYSARHQFSANAKASGFLPEELAAMMGHAVDITAARHYGRKVTGFEIVRVRPDPKEVERVRKLDWGRYQGPGQEPMPEARVSVRPAIPTAPTPPDQT